MNEKQILIATSHEHLCLSETTDIYNNIIHICVRGMHSTQQNVIRTIYLSNN